MDINPGEHFYTNSKGQRVDITTVHPAHLIAARDKLRRMNPESEDLLAMDALVKQQGDQFAVEQQAKEQMR